MLACDTWLRESTLNFDNFPKIQKNLQVIPWFFWWDKEMLAAKQEKSIADDASCFFRRERRVTTIMLDGENADADAFLAQVK